MLKNRDITVPCEHCEKRATIYYDTDAKVKACILYFHGGGLLYGSRTDTLSSHSIIPLRRLPSLTLYLRMCVLPSTISSDIYPYIWKRKPNKAPTSLTSCGDVLPELTSAFWQPHMEKQTKSQPESSPITDTASCATGGS